MTAGNGAVHSVDAVIMPKVLTYDSSDGHDGDNYDDNKSNANDDKGYNNCNDDYNGHDDDKGNDDNDDDMMMMIKIIIKMTMGIR